MLPAPSQSQIQTALRSFLLSVLPSGVDAFEGQDNRVPEPSATDFVVMTTIRRPRLATNIDISADVAFVGSISGTTLTVSEVALGAISSGATLFGPGVSAGSVIGTQQSGMPGGAGTYLVSPSQSVSSATLSCGTTQLLQETDIVVQLDFHSANVGDAADMAQVVSTTFRDGYAVQQFATSGFAVTPLYADDPRQVPFLNAEQQFETRWSVDLHLQANQTVSLPQTYADAATVVLVDVDAIQPQVSPMIFVPTVLSGI